MNSLIALLHLEASGTLLYAFYLYLIAPPTLPKLSSDELTVTAEYHERLNRKGVHNHGIASGRDAAVIQVGQAKEKRVFLLGPRKWGTQIDG